MHSAECTAYSAQSSAQLTMQARTKQRPTTQEMTQRRTARSQQMRTSHCSPVMLLSSPPRMGVMGLSSTPWMEVSSHQATVQARHHIGMFFVVWNCTVYSVQCIILQCIVLMYSFCCVQCIVYTCALYKRAAYIIQKPPHTTVYRVP